MNFPQLRVVRVLFRAGQHAQFRLGQGQRVYDCIRKCAPILQSGLPRWQDRSGKSAA